MSPVVAPRGAQGTAPFGAYVTRAGLLTSSVRHDVINKAVTIGGCYTCAGHNVVQCQNTRSNGLPFSEGRSRLKADMYALSFRS
jgi:hypothetical protein